MKDTNSIIKNSVYLDSEREINPDHKAPIIINESEIDKELINIEYERITNNINQFKKLRNQYLNLLISIVNNIDNEQDIIELKDIKALSDLIESLYIFNETITEEKNKLLNN